MAKNTDVFFTKATRAKPTELTAADGANAKLIFNPSEEGSRVEAIVVCSTSATQRASFVQLNNANTGEVAQLGHITVPAGAGQGVVNAVNGMNRGNLPWMQLDANGNPYINLNHNMNLEVRLPSALAAGERITVAVMGGNFDA